MYTVLQFLRSAHRSDLVAIFVHGFTAGDLAGTLTFQIAEAGDIGIWEMSEWANREK